MKSKNTITVVVKSPDCIDYAIDDYIESNQIPEDEAAEVRKQIKQKLSMYFKYGEYLKIEFDLDMEETPEVKINL